MNSAPATKPKRPSIAFTDGQTYSCWYDPADPSIAVLVRGYQWWIWPALLIPASFVVIGIGGLVYTALHWGKSAERRAAARGSRGTRGTSSLVAGRRRFVRPATGRRSEVPLHSRRQRDHQQSRHAPGLPPAADALARLDPLRAVGGLVSSGTAAVSVFVVMAVRSVLLAVTPDWLMMLFILPFLGVGVALVVVFARLPAADGRHRTDAGRNQRPSALARPDLPGLPLAIGQPDAENDRDLA